MSDMDLEHVWRIFTKISLGINLPWKKKDPDLRVGFSVSEDVASQYVPTTWYVR